MIQTAYFHPEHSPNDNQIVADFVSQVIWGKTVAWKDFLTMAVMDNGTLIGGVIFHGYDPSSKIIELSAGSVSKKWLTRPVIRAMFSLPFRMLDCQLVLLRVASDNPGMQRIARSFGFDEFVIPRLFGRETNGHLFTLTKEQWLSHKVNRDAL